MTEAKSPVDQALDFLVYAPLGLVFSARELIPELAERGRRQLTDQVGMARLIGQFAVKHGTAEAEKALVKAREQAVAKLGELMLNGSGDDRATPPPPEPPPAADADPVERATPAPAPTPTPPVAAPGPAVVILAIPDYDSLSAYQVVPRLSGLAPAELEGVRAYEAAHRGRKTILSRVMQLQSGQ